MNAQIFREFSIRGMANHDLTNDVVETLGKAIGTFFHALSIEAVTVGRDIRLSSPVLSEALVVGLLDTGINVIDLGAVPTSVFNFATDFYELAGGVMVTASHNPPMYNGLKIRTDHTIGGIELQRIRHLAQSGAFASGRGTRVERNPLEPYFVELRARTDIRRSLRVVVDAGDGSNGPVVPVLLRDLGCQVIELYCDPDGSFPNRDPDPTAAGATHALAHRVLQEKADIGLAYDGDGDRVIIVDDQGRTALGDELLMLLARDVLQAGPAKIVYEVLCTEAVADDVAAHGGTPVPCPSGYAFVHEMMRAQQAALGGEMSGHFFFQDESFRFDDAILASCRLLSILSSQDRPLSSLLDDLPHYYTSPELRLPCSDHAKGEVVQRMAEHFRGRYPLVELDGVKVLFDDGWALIRQSNTQPVVSLRFEAKSSAERLQDIQSAVVAPLRAVYADLGLEWPEAT